MRVRAPKKLSVRITLALFLLTMMSTLSATGYTDTLQSVLNWWALEQRVVLDETLPEPASEDSGPAAEPAQPEEEAPTTGGASTGGTSTGGTSTGGSGQETSVVIYVQVATPLPAASWILGPERCALTAADLHPCQRFAEPTILGQVQGQRGALNGCCETLATLKQRFAGPGCPLLDSTSQLNTLCSH